MKRPPPSVDAETASSGSKKRRRMSISDEDDVLKTPGGPSYHENPSLHKIYNSSCRKEKPDELFRKDLISAMKLPDNEQLDEKDFWDVSDSWKQEWERGVQVPVNSKNVPNPVVRVIRDKRKTSPIKLPKKFIRTTEDSFFSNEHHVLSEVGKKAENICKYDLDDLDSHWLKIINERREDLGLCPISEETLELILEDFETQCSNRFQDALKNEKGLGIEYDEDVICDVCRSPECEEGNEMVFCDSCNICVHQACYGITAIPEGSWICRPCALNIKPPCLLCPNMGGAMKSTSSGEKWAHVSCALWIPEVSIGCPEKMEPIMRISHIPTSRWALICALCRERVGACIQCSVKQCKVAYHVTCAFEHGLEMEMKTTPIDSSEEGVKMQSYCVKHSKTDAADRITQIKSPRKIKKKKDLKPDDPNCKDEVDEHNARLQRIRSLEAQFHRFVNIKDTAEFHNIDIDVVDFLYYYWVLKRKAKFNKPLLIAKCDEANHLLIKQHENLLYSRLKMFVHLRQDLERVRNLCYMVSRREKIFRSYIRMKSQVFEKQAEILSDESLKFTPEEVQEILRARLGDNLYDRFYCVVFDEVKKEESDDKDSISNQKLDNPYARSYTNNINTRSRRHTVSHSTIEDENANCDNESREMPILTKCKSEENLSADEKQKIFTHSPFVIKISPKHENMKTENSESDDDKIPDIVHDRPVDIKVLSGFENSISEDTKYLEPLTIADNSNEVPKIINNETSSDKNSLCLSDKENIHALGPIKVKKSRQTEQRHTEFKNVIHEITGQKPDIYDEDSCLSLNSEIGAIDKKNKRNTRYHMRSRNFNNDIIELDDSSEKSLDLVDAQLSHSQTICTSSDNVQDLPFLTEDQSDKSLEITPRRKRGRPRKIIRCDSASDASFAVIKNENDVSKTNSCDEILELSDSNESTGFRMSLRHNREQLIMKPSNRKTKRKRSVVKSDHSDLVPLKETNKGTCNDTIETENVKNSPEWTPSKSTRLSSPEKPSSPRIIIRLRKDPNRESWKNDSSSSSDGNVAFHIVQNDLGVNGEDSISHFPSIIKDEDSIHADVYSVKNDSENKHRYSMRDRTTPARTAKCNLSRS